MRRFLLLLGLKLGKDSEEMESMPMRRVYEYVALNKIAPFLDERTDVQTGIIAAAVMRAQGVKCKPSDFIPRWDQPAERDPEEIAVMMKAFATQHNANVRAKERKRK